MAANTWSSGLFGCFSDFPSCFMGFCFTPCLYASNNAKLSEDSGAMCSGSWVGSCLSYAIFMNCGLCCIPHMGTRSAVKKKYGIVEQENEFLITCLCGPCAMCQEAREHKTRGF